MAQKPVYVSANEFNEKIKNNLRDFYVYQFKRFRNDSTSDYRKKGTAQPKPASTFSEEKQRLMSMLEPHGQVLWTAEKGGICCCTADTRLLEENPFWEPFRYCAPAARNQLAWAMQLVLLTHPGIRLRNPQGLPEPTFPKALQPVRPDATVRLRPMSKENLESWLDGQLVLHYPDPHWGRLCLERYFALQKTRLNGRTMRLEPDPNALGMSRQLLQDLSDRTCPACALKDPDQFKNRLEDQQYHFVKPLRLSQRKELWALGNGFFFPHTFDRQTNWRIRQMLSFFSRTMSMSFIGQRLKKRFGDEQSIFRYKNSYIIQALNDYNLCDLLQAIRQKRWLCMESRNGRTLQLQRTVCLPLQLRESTQTGRQYLLYYHPGYRSIGSIRLDFIDKLQFGTVAHRGYFDRDLEQAQKALPHIWQCSVPGFYRGNLTDGPKLSLVELTFSREKPTLEPRLRREARFGQIRQDGDILHYQAAVTDPREMVPWLRSFGSSLLSVRLDGVSVESPEALAAQLDREGPEVPSQPEPIPFREDKQAAYAHTQLFSFAFSAAFDALGYALCAMLQQPDRYYIEADIRSLLRQGWEGDPLQEELEDLLFENITALCAGNLRRGFRLNYIPEEGCRCSTLTDLLPLSQPESAWLLGVLDHPKAQLFLTPAEIETLRAGICPDTVPTDFGGVRLCDQYSDVTPVYTQPTTRAHFQTLLDCIYAGKQVDVTYTSQLGPEQHRLSVSGFLYSKTEDKFWALCTDAAGVISRRNLERFTSVRATDLPSTAPDLGTLLERITTENTRRLSLVFPDEKNLAERLVSELSPWSKRCTCNDQTEPRLFRIDLDYDTMDTAELLLRLRRYGPALEVPAP